MQSQGNARGGAMRLWRVEVAISPLLGGDGYANWASELGKRIARGNISEPRRRRGLARRHWQKEQVMPEPHPETSDHLKPTGRGHSLHEAEHVLLEKLRSARRRLRADHEQPGPELTLGQRVADSVAAGMGSWRFIIIQSSILLAWIIFNVATGAHHWDPYPFILLNLALSFQAAYAAPFIMMSQNRQQDIDRAAAQNDYKVNLKAELEIELLHQKLDQLREQEVLELTRAVQSLAAQLDARRAQSE
jgi:uncharacterized membrane protein